MTSIIRTVLGVAVGGIIGFLYYRLVGCRTGACPIAGNPWISTAWWALIGGLFMSGFKS